MDIPADQHQLYAEFGMVAEKAQVLEVAAGGQNGVSPVCPQICPVSDLPTDFPAFSGRILAIDTAVAQRCATFHVPNPRSDRDALIAATALVHGLTVATRNVPDFEHTGVGVVNPWEA